MRSLPLVALILAAACSPSSARMDSTTAAQPARTVAAATQPLVIELYQSQGCSSCPPANAALNGVAGRPDILALSFAVTYWDQLGWKDSFARPEYTARQWDYANASKRGRVATPELIFNGQAEMTGGDPNHFAQLIRQVGPVRGGPSIAPVAGGAQIGAAKASAPATIWLVRYDPRVRNVAIRAGENGGRTLPHRNIVTQLTKLGEWHGQPLKLAFAGATDPALRSALLVQEEHGGPIIAARKL